MKILSKSTKRESSKRNYRTPIKVLQNDKFDTINVYKDNDTGKIRAEGDIVGASFNGPWGDSEERYYKSIGFREVTEGANEVGSVMNIIKLESSNDTPKVARAIRRLKYIQNEISEAIRYLESDARCKDAICNTAAELYRANDIATALADDADKSSLIDKTPSAEDSESGYDFYDREGNFVKTYR